MTITVSRLLKLSAVCLPLALAACGNMPDRLYGPNRTTYNPPLTPKHGAPNDCQLVNKPAETKYQGKRNPRAAAEPEVSYKSW